MRIMYHLLRGESLFVLRLSLQKRMSKKLNRYYKMLKTKLILIHLNLKHRYCATKKKCLGGDKGVANDAKAKTCGVSNTRRLESLLSLIPL